MILCDTHAHLDDSAFDDCRDHVIEAACRAGVTRMIAIGTTLASSKRCIAIADSYPSVWAAVGIQPNYCHEASPDDWPQIVDMCQHRRVVAIGETGLDRYWHDTPIEIQRDFFDRHLRLAQRFDLPVVIHMRESGADIVEMLVEAHRRGPLRGVMHSFTGDESLAARCVELGLYISFAGMITFKKSVELREVAKQVPIERLLLETDSPYLSPEPFRGKRPNEPARLVHTATCVAELRAMDPAELAHRTTANALELFDRIPSADN